jgi:cytochrome c553
MQTRYLTLLVATWLPGAVAVAAPSSTVAWDVPTMRLVRAGDAARGAELETVETEDSLACAACHGKGGGRPDRDKYPMIAGQTATYVYKQLMDFKTGKRENRRMQRAVETLDPKQLAALAQWYAAQPTPSPEVDPEDTFSDAALALVFRGDKQRLIQPCASCHGATGNGAVMDVPALAGQNPRYFVETMKDYAKGDRKNDVYSKMRLIAERLSREEIDQLAVYYARLGAKVELAESQ